MIEVDKLIAEGNALTSALAVVEENRNADRARELCLHYFEHHHDLDSLESSAIDCALRRICGLPSTEYSDLHEPSEADAFFETGVTKWIEWAGDRIEVDDELDITFPNGEPKSLNDLALKNWLEAVHNLLKGCESEGRRYFRRATTLSGEYGVESNPVIQWTYAASFFPKTDRITLDAYL